MVHDFSLRLLGVAAIFSCGFLLEKLIPADKSATSRGRFFNCVYTVFFEAMDVATGVGVAVAVASLLNLSPIHGLIPLGSDHGSIWLSIPLAFFGVICADFFYYWFHRLQHASQWLWAQHVLHHSDECMNITTALRHHWLERPLYGLFVTLPMMIIFKPAILTIAAATMLATLPGYFVHLNARVRYGWLNYVFASPQSHRIHHSMVPEHFDKNFAVSFALWDVVFGTYYHPQRQDWPRTGVEGVTVTSLWQAVAMPFYAWFSVANRVYSPRASESMNSKKIMASSSEGKEMVTSPPSGAKI